MDQADEADGQVAQNGHDLGAASGAQLGAVLVEDHVSDPVEAVLYPQCPRIQAATVSGWASVMGREQIR